MSITAPKGYVVIDADSSQIEARIIAWLAGQDDLVTAFGNKEDVYKIMASAIYNKPVEDVNKEERFVGKTTILGAGYGMGAQRFQDQLKTSGVELTLDECKHIINTYRSTYSKIPDLWAQAQTCLEAIHTNKHADIGAVPVLEFSSADKGFKLPNGLWQRYDTLYKRSKSDGYDEFVYKTRKGDVKLYGGKLVENLCQALARCVIAEQMVKISKRYKVVLTVHDAVACIAPKVEAVEAQQYVEECMRWRPEWAKTLPLNCESGLGNSYGDC
jgi:DNA polymerase bacteriophage-type